MKKWRVIVEYTIESAALNTPEEVEWYLQQSSKHEPKICLVERVDRERSGVDPATAVAVFNAAREGKLRR